MSAMFQRRAVRRCLQLCRTIGQPGSLSSYNAARGGVTSEAVASRGLTTMRAVYAEDGKAVLRDVPVPTPGRGEVLLKVEAAGVNRADCVQRSGNYPPPPGASEALGLEVVGRVEACGPEADGQVAPGSRVMTILAGGGYAEYCTAPAATCIPADSGKAATDLCAIPEAWITAYQLLMYVGKVQKGEVVLIHAGASSVGMAATQMALQVAGALPIITCSAGKMDMVRKLGATQVVDRNANDGDWTAAVKDAANALRQAQGLPERKGVELVLDPVGGSYWSHNAEVLAADGRLVVYGLMGGAKVKGIILGDILRKRLQVLGTTLRAREVVYKQELSHRFAAEVLPLLMDGTLQAPVDRVMKLQDAEEALNVMMSNANLGKIVLVP
eukprot:TRINITY_DN41309_c0_g1_i1.p1 TRINITY_DN41309_c0_g1~~TRINITY_DN41309_c0_g1_i1.p1  ORF type:complete len:384 (-),score=94.89 TRINITY_DN41309_c0_g1_i1:10-1161(-)